MDKMEITGLIEKYINGTATCEEDRKLMEWYRSARIDYVEWPSGAGEEEAVRKRMHNRIMKEINAHGHKRFISGMLKVAVVISGLLAGIYMIYAVVRQSPPRYLSISSKPGEIKYLLLPDSSKVWLNAGSAIRFPERFDQSAEIELDGEAFFDVKHNESRSFKVHSGGITTTDFGTTFNIRAPGYSNHVVVTLETGKIRIDRDAASLGTLSPGQELTFDRISKKATLKTISAGQTSAWKDGKLDFNDLSLEDISERLSDWYGVHFVFKDEQIKRCSYNASFDNTIPLSDLLTLLCKVNKIHFTINRDTVILGGMQ